MSLDKLKEKLTKKFRKEYAITCEVFSKISVFDLTYELESTAILKNIKEFINKFPKSMLDYNFENTNVRAWHSDYHTHKLTNILDPLIKETKIKLQIVLGEKVLSEVQSIWINDYQKNDKALRHLHGYMTYSSVYFPYAEDDATPIIFDSNHLINKKEIPITPKTGMLICFPSWLPHQVPMVKESKRVSVSANWVVKNLESENRDPATYQ